MPEYRPLIDKWMPTQSASGTIRMIFECYLRACLKNGKSNTKILIVIACWMRRTETHLTRVLPALNSDSRQIRVVCFRKGGALAEVLKSKGIEVRFPDFSKKSYVSPKFSRVTTIILAIGFLAREFLSYKPDIAHYFLPEAYILGGLLSIFRHPLSCHESTVAKLLSTASTACTN